MLSMQKLYTSRMETPCWHLIIQWLELLTSSKSDGLPEWPVIDAVISVAGVTSAVESSGSWSVKLSGDCIQVHVGEQWSYHIKFKSHINTIKYITQHPVHASRDFYYNHWWPPRSAPVFQALSCHMRSVGEAWFRRSEKRRLQQTISLTLTHVWYAYVHALHVGDTGFTYHHCIFLGYATTFLPVRWDY